MEDLARPLRDKLAEGKIRLPEVDLDRPGLPADLSLHREDDLWVITLRPIGRARRIALLLVIAMAVLGIGAVFYVFPGSLPPLLTMLGSATVVIAGVILLIVSTARRLRQPNTELVIEPDHHNRRRLAPNAGQQIDT